MDVKVEGFNCSIATLFSLSSVTVSLGSVTSLLCSPEAGYLHGSVVQLFATKTALCLLTVLVG